MRNLLTRTAGIAARYLETLEDRQVAPAPEAVERLKELDQPLADSPRSPEEVLELLDRFGDSSRQRLAA